MQNIAEYIHRLLLHFHRRHCDPPYLALAMYLCSLNIALLRPTGSSFFEITEVILEFASPD